MKDTKNIAILAAKTAGEFLLKNFRKHKELISERGVSKEISTKFDKKGDEIIRDIITRNFPEHSLLTEESGLSEKSSEHLWIVDSLDGSGNFALGNPFFGISIAYLYRGETKLGVIYLPYLDELYTAEKGKGAFMNGKKISVSGVDSIEKSYILTCEGGEKDNRRISEINYRLHARVKDLRKLGSACAEACYVASGRAEAYITTSIYPWDVAAGVLIVQEASGKATDFEGNPWKIEQMDLIISNGRVHNEIIGILRNSAR